MTHRPSPLTAADRESFAYLTVKDRLPVIIAKIADSLSRNREQLNERYKGQDADTQLKTIIGSMSCLRHEIMTNKGAVPLKDTGPDAIAWNQELETEVKINGGTPPTWFNSPWLWMECYMYRRVQEAVLLSSSYKSLDVFEEQKQNSFTGSMESISTITRHLYRIIKDKPKSVEEINQYFKEFFLVSLWGNKMDLSLTAGQDINHTENPVHQLHRLMPQILLDDTDKVLNLLRKKQESGRGAKISFILDNAGFEFMTDLCLAEYLLSTGLASSIQFHGKAYPWYVSDVTEGDVTWTLEQVSMADQAEMSELGDIWKRRLQDGTFTFQYHSFWTTPHPIHKMESLCPDLYSKLGQTDLALFKGDLNYRKLVADLKWDPTTSFKTSLLGFHPTAVCSLRTVKADVIVGLKPGQAQQVKEVDANWTGNGNWAVISLDQ